MLGEDERAGSAYRLGNREYEVQRINYITIIGEVRGRLNFLQQNALCKLLYIVAGVVSYIHTYIEMRETETQGWLGHRDCVQ